MQKTALSIKVCKFIMGLRHGKSSFGCGQILRRSKDVFVGNNCASIDTFRRQRCDPMAAFVLVCGFIFKMYPGNSWFGFRSIAMISFCRSDPAGSPGNPEWFSAVSVCHGYGNRRSLRPRKKN